MFGDIVCDCLILSKFVLFLQHDMALELLSEQLQNGARALDVGSGSGYLTACMAIMVICFYINI